MSGNSVAHHATASYMVRVTCDRAGECLDGGGLADDVTQVISRSGTTKVVSVGGKSSGVESMGRSGS